MDKVVDHLLVFQGDGQVKDFPGNYSQFRAWEKEQQAASMAVTRSARSTSSGSSSTPEKTSSRTDPALSRPRRLSFKERREMETLEATIAQLEAEKAELESALCSGALSVDELTAKSRRLPQLQEELDTAELRWLELSEIEG